MLAIDNLVQIIRIEIFSILGGGIVLVFLSDLIGNILSFSNRRLNAIITAAVWGAAFYPLTFFDVQITSISISHEEALALTVLGIQSVFVADVIGNSLVFNNRILNALVTSTVWAVVFYVTLIALVQAASN
ncbi:MAG: hypothetical protein AAFR90_00195 [Pseudomonadota bacterium]